MTTTEDTRPAVTGTQRVPGSETLFAGRRAFRYRGIIREGTRVVWTCEHEHEYRDGHTYQWKVVHGPSGAALTCAQDELTARSQVPA